MLKPAAAVQSLSVYQPPLGRRVGLRFDFNENTSGCSPRVVEAVRALTAAEFATYPDRASGESILAQHLDLDPRQVLLTNGVDEAIHLVAESFLNPGDEVIIPVPTFAMYEIYARATGAKVSLIPAGANFEFSLPALHEAISPKTKLILLANPNNPTGLVLPNESLIALGQAAPHAAFLVDEAYYEFHRTSMLPELSRLPNLFVARTFSKAYGLAGLRLGAIVGHREHLEILRKVSSPYNVNAVGLACLKAALDDTEFVNSYVAEVINGRAALESLLRDLRIPFCPSQANFVLARIGDRHAEFVDLMRERGVLVRDRNNDPGCADCVRIGIGRREQNTVLFRALREAIELIHQ